MIKFMFNSLSVLLLYVLVIYVSFTLEHYNVVFSIARGVIVSIIVYGIWHITVHKYTNTLKD